MVGARMSTSLISLVLAGLALQSSTEPHRQRRPHGRQEEWWHAAVPYLIHLMESGKDIPIVSLPPTQGQCTVQPRSASGASSSL